MFVTANSKVVVLHWKSDGTCEKLPFVLGDGTVTATFTSFSPVAIIVESSENGESGEREEMPLVQAKLTGRTELEIPVDGLNADDSAIIMHKGAAVTTVTAAVSPKTAETNMIYGVAAIAMAACVGMIVLGKKMRTE